MASPPQKPSRAETCSGLVSVMKLMPTGCHGVVPSVGAGWSQRPSTEMVAPGLLGWSGRWRLSDLIQPPRNSGVLTGTAALCSQRLSSGRVASMRTLRRPVCATAVSQVPRAPL